MKRLFVLPQLSRKGWCILFLVISNVNEESPPLRHGISPVGRNKTACEHSLYKKLCWKKTSWRRTATMWGNSDFSEIMKFNWPIIKGKRSASPEEFVYHLYIQLVTAMSKHIVRVRSQLRKNFWSTWDRQPKCETKCTRKISNCPLFARSSAVFLIVS